jgi:hypothetical protein
MAPNVSALRALRDDLKAFAAECLKIRNKQGDIVPFRFNRTQEEIHRRLEEQRARCGWVRALILKGRQQGACLDPHTRVLGADLTWREISTLRPGDEVVACDENIPGGKGRARRMCTAIVEAIAFTKKKAYRISFDDGRSVICSGDHRWLTCKSNPQLVWRTLDGGHGGAITVGTKVRWVTKPWGTPDAFDGWFGGILDGEGTMASKKESGSSVSISQRLGTVLDRCMAYAAMRGLYYSYCSDNSPKRRSKFGGNPVDRIEFSRMDELFKLLGLARPVRFLHRRFWEGKELPGKRNGFGLATVTKIEALPEQVLVDLQTTTKTFIAEGFVSHNSTYVAARFYHKASMRKGVNVFILSHEQSASDTLFGIVDRYHRNNPLAPHIGKSNVKELEFDLLDSSYVVSTAGAKAGGRSKALSLFHGSEVAFWPNASEHFAASVQGVPLAAGTEIILESTSAGAGGEFFHRYQQAEAGLSDYIAIFCPWFWDDGYRRPVPEGFSLSSEADEGEMSEQEYMETYGLTMEQMVWRRMKIEELRSATLFRREYPATAADAWTAPPGKEPYIDPILVMRARIRKTPGVGPLIIGVDPAANGGDRFSVAWRRGMRCEKVQYRMQLELPEAVAWLKAIIDADNPARMNIDAGNTGSGIVSALKALGPKYANIVRGVNFGGTSESKMARPKVPGPANRRAEMWMRMREWLTMEEGAALPADDALQSDLTGPRLKPKLNNDFLLEKKEDMKKRGIRSPDLADALALTFASNEFFKDYHMPRTETIIEQDARATGGVAPLPDIPIGRYSWMA